MKTQRDYEDFDGRVIGFAAIACSGFTIAACLLLLPMMHNQMDMWQVAIEAQLRDVRAMSDDSWNDMMKIRDEMKFDRAALSAQEVASAAARVRVARQAYGGERYGGQAPSVPAGQAYPSDQNYPAAQQPAWQPAPQPQYPQPEAPPVYTPEEPSYQPSPVPQPSYTAPQEQCGKCSLALHTD
uniref:Nematode cuticle collagen N-terminal domain-containing protein n=1 Tax=Plectus sambesii TaxID=2011161 RepID=A0A914UZC3_9BILA